MKVQRFLVFLATTALLLPVTMLISDHAQGGLPVFQASIKVLSEDRSRNQQSPMDILVNEEGRVSIIYQTFEMYYWDIYIVHSYDDGVTWSDPIRVDDTLRDGNESNDGTTQWEPSMVLGPDGAINVVWEDRRGYMKDNQLFTEPIRIRYSRSLDGETFTPSVEITATKTINTWHAYRPDLAVNQEGRLVCVWEDKDQAGAYRNTWSAYSTDDGRNWSEPIMLNCDGKDYCDHKYPRVAMFGDNVYVTWHDDRNDTTGTIPYMAVSHDGGETFGLDFPLSSDTQQDAVRDYAFPVVDDVGNLYVAWHDRRTERDELFFTRSEDNGATFTKDNRIFVLPEEASDMFPHLHASGDGDLSLVWERHIPFDLQMGTSTESDIFYMNSSDGGRTWGKKLMVDDTDRYRTDRTDQEWVFSTFNNEGRALCVWKDSREEVVGATDFDIYFSRHSSSLSQINDLPEILYAEFMGEYGFNRAIGNSSTLFNFAIIYRDEQNDGPGDGFPRMQVFRDDQGTDPVFPDWMIMERTLGPSDIYFIDGVAYYCEIAIPEEGQFYYRVQTTDGVDPTIVSSSLIEGPLIDLTIPTLEMIGPTEMEWIASEKVRCSAVIEDAGGAGIRNNTIGYMKSVNGPYNFEDPQKAGGFTRIDNNSYEAWAVVDLEPGTENYVKFVARDRVGNGYGESEMINLWIDFDAPYATDPAPKTRDLQIYPNVNCSITWRDNNPGSTLFNFTGLDPTTIRYAYKTTSGDFSEWMEPDGYIRTGPESYRSWANVEFPDEGNFNYIKWKASDLVGNEGESKPHFVTVDVPENYRPVFTGKGYPGLISSPMPHLWWDAAYDEEGDPLTYRVMLLKHPSELILMAWEDIGPRTYYDIPDNEALDPDHYILRINVTDRIGGCDIYDHVFKVIDTGTPPPEMVPQPGPYYMKVPGTISWDPSPDDNGEMEYWIRIGSRVDHGDILEWRDLGSTKEFDLAPLDLELGIYSLQIMCFHAGNFSRVTKTIIKISDYKLETNQPSTFIAYKGVAGIRMTDPLVCYIINNGTYGDNVSVRISGDLVEKGYAFLNSSGVASDTYFIEAARLSADDTTFKFTISIQPEDNARIGTYSLIYTIISEDKGTNITSSTITVNVKNAPDESGGGSIADGLSDFITDIFPFLEGLPTGVVIALFLIILLALIGGIVYIGIFVAKRSAQKKRDPFAEQKRIYKEIYGRDPTPEEITAMRGEKDESSTDITKEGEEDAQSPQEEDQVIPPEATESGQTIPIPVDDKIDTGDKETDELLDRLFD